MRKRKQKKLEQKKKDKANKKKKKIANKIKVRQLEKQIESIKRKIEEHEKNQPTLPDQ